MSSTRDRDISSRLAGRKKSNGPHMSSRSLNWLSRSSARKLRLSISRTRQHGQPESALKGQNRVPRAVYMLARPERAVKDCSDAPATLDHEGQPGTDAHDAAQNRGRAIAQRELALG